MFELVMYGIGFFLVTIFLQGILYKCRKNQNQGKSQIWVGNSAIIVICVIGIATKDICYIAAILGFVVADEVGKAFGWN